jgi:acetyl-CoA carboxylase alpha subunit
VLVCEHAIFSVIAPEGAAAILRRDDVEGVARDLKLTASDLLDLGIADGLVAEPPGGAHTDPGAAKQLIGEAVGRALGELSGVPSDQRLAERRRRWREAGNAFLVG